SPTRSEVHEMEEFTILLTGASLALGLIALGLGGVEEQADGYYVRKRYSPGLCRGLVELVPGDGQWLGTRGHKQDQLPTVCPRRRSSGAARGRTPRWARALITALLLCGWCSMAPLPTAASWEAPQTHTTTGASLIHLHDGR